VARRRSSDAPRAKAEAARAPKAEARRRGSSGPSAGALALRIFGAGLALGLVGVLAVNGAVRRFGGEPEWLSPDALEAKARALGRLAAHLAEDVVDGCHAERASVVRRAARRAGVPVELALAIAEAETGLEPHRVSAAGAMGIMQLTRETAARFGVDDPYDVEQGVRGGVAFLAELMRRYPGDLDRVAAAYNAGPGGVDGREHAAWPGETRAYVARVRRALGRGARTTSQP
jgi:hypothetical protein